MPPKTTKQTAPQARRQSPRRAFLFVDDRQRDKFYSTFGRRVRELRMQQGLTQEALAKMAGIDRSYLSQIEAGKRHMALHVAWNLANSFGVSLALMVASDL